MPWRTSYHQDLRIVESRYEGRLDASQLAEATEATLALARQWGADRFLADCTALEGGHSALDLFGVLERLQSDDELPRGWRNAIVGPSTPDAARDVDFWETLCRNRGLNVRIFAERDAAVTWLLERPRSS